MYFFTKTYLRIVCEWWPLPEKHAFAKNVKIRVILKNIGRPGYNFCGMQVKVSCTIYRQCIIFAGPSGMAGSALVYTIVYWRRDIIKNHDQPTSSLLYHTHWSVLGACTLLCCLAQPRWACYVSTSCHICCVVGCNIHRLCQISVVIN